MYDAGCQLEADEASETEGSLADELDSPLWALYTFVAHYKNAAGQLMSEPFNRMPNRKFYPDYYDEIETPISLLKIKTKIRVRPPAGPYGQFRPPALTASALVQSVL